MCLCHLSPQFPLNTSDSTWGPGGLRDVQDGGFQAPVRTATQLEEEQSICYLKGPTFEGFLINVKSLLKLETRCFLRSEMSFRMI